MDTTRANPPCQSLLGASPSMQRVRQQLQEVAATALTVLLLGETGTGKGVAARMVHQWSPRSSGPFGAVNCGALPANLVDSGLFGHERGAFTGAVAQKRGKFELANRGTLFLDEIADLPLESQTRPLCVLQEWTFERVGGTHTLSLDVRVIAATHQDLRQAVRDGRFRQDLYHRLHVFPIRGPPLRERLDDLPLLAAHFVGHELTAQALAVLQTYDWPGNVRELEHALQRAQVLARGGPVRPEHILLEPAEEAMPAELLPGQVGCEQGAMPAVPEAQAAPPEQAGLSRRPGAAALLRPVPLAILPLAEFERQYLTQVLAHTRGVIHGERGAAREPGGNPMRLRRPAVAAECSRCGALVPERQRV
jgi:transcriptional regulator with GAF, ATPase, and Fis domain